MSKGGGISRDRGAYERYKRDVEQVNDEIDLKTSVGEEKREGVRGIRDRVAFWKLAFHEASGYAYPIREVIILMMAYTGFEAINSLMNFLGLPFYINPNFGTIFVLFVIAGMMVFGILSFKRVGLFRRASEISAKQGPQFYVLYRRMDELEKKLQELSEEVDKEVEDEKRGEGG